VPTGRQRVWLRRYHSSADEKNPCALQGYHHAMTLIGEAAEQKDEQGCICSISPEVYNDDPRWPAQCECGYEFKILGDEWQVFTRALFRREDTGEEMTTEDAPAGAIWNAWWYGKFARGEDGLSLVCKLPGGHDWLIDGVASNCDSRCANCRQPRQACGCKYPNGFRDSRPHKCWVRHGAPPNLTVDKQGITCGAGAGSIIVPGWHGFLVNGVLKPC
jgi:hypothetical protein